MWDCLQRRRSPSLLGSFSNASLALLFLTLSFLIFSTLFFWPEKAHAASTFLWWGDIVYNGDYTFVVSDDRIQIQDGGTYHVALGVSKEMTPSAPDNAGFYYLQGHLYRVDPTTHSRIDLGLIGFGGKGNIAWDAYGSYEVDMFDLGAPVLSHKNIWQKLFGILFGNTTYADAGAFIETLHFILTPDAGPNTPPVLTLPENSTGVYPERGTPASTKFVFRIIYTDLENNPPQFVHLLLGTTPYTLISSSTASSTLHDGIYSNGEEFGVTIQIPIHGEQSFGFETSDGVATTTVIASTHVITGFSNVAFLPGLEGSYLDKHGIIFEDEVWLPTPGFAGNGDLGQVSMNPDGTSKEAGIYTKENDLILKAYNLLPVYAGFPESMDALVSSHLINSWKPLVYDWRLDFDSILSSGKKDGDHISYLSPTSTPYLYQELTKLALTSQSGKVTIITHSNGGLVAKTLLADLEARHDPLFDKIDLVILVAPPQLGTPVVLLSLLHGADNSLEYISASDSAWRTATRYAPAAYNMIPSEDYFTYTLAAPIITFGQSLDRLADTIHRRDVEGYQGSALPPVFDYRTRYGNDIGSYTALIDFLKGAEGRREPVSDDINNPTLLSNALLTQARDTHRRIDTWTPPDRDNDGVPDIKIVQVAGWGIDTVRALNYETKQNIPSCVTSPGGRLGCLRLYGVEANPVYTTTGDGTVVLPSATLMPVPTYYIDLRTYNEAAVDPMGVKVREHGNMMAAQPVMGLISHLIQGESTDAIPYVSTLVPARGDFLQVEMHSPIAMDFYDGKGGHVGSTTDQASHISYIEKTIPNSTYLKMGDSTFVTLPTQSTYTIRLDGTGSGTSTLIVKKFVRDTLATTTSFSDITTTAALLGTMTISPIATTSSLLLDTNGDGRVDKVVRPDRPPKKIPALLLADLRQIVASSTMASTTQAVLYNLILTAERSLGGTDKKYSALRKALSVIEKYIEKMQGTSITKVDAKKLLAILEQIEELLDD